MVTHHPSTFAPKQEVQPKKPCTSYRILATSVEFDQQDEVEFQDDVRVQWNNLELSKIQQRHFDSNADSECWILEFQLRYSMVCLQRS